MIQGGDPLGDGSGGPGYSVVEPPPYQKLGGAWIDGKDPADGIARTTGEQR